MIVEDNENIVDTLHREILEETDLSNLKLVRKIGVHNYYKPIKRNVGRYDFLLLVLSDTLGLWEHHECDRRRQRFRSVF
ncbi:NUDIX domain-containing protein [Salipaludibacillus agaradhaerens]|uniref:NUDIX domain-containing protein n=1 Tax=Salipaludibacillus agaradhaerens TaxID=76935 RepID=UPI0014743A8C